MVKTHEIVQKVKIGKDKVPSIILYTENQLQDIKRLCCSSPLAHSTALGVDKTFINLGDVHVTVCVFKYVAVTRRDTNEYPLFAGPFYLHGNSDFLSYNSFFSHPAGKLRGAPSHPIFGTDNEKEMKQVMQAAFPDSGLPSCTRHLKQNVDAYLKDTIGVCRKDRSSIINSIFRPSDITSADEDVTFDHALKKTEELIHIFAPSFNIYF